MYAKIMMDEHISGYIMYVIWLNIGNNPISPAPFHMVWRYTKVWKRIIIIVIVVVIVHHHCHCNCHPCPRYHHHHHHLHHLIVVTTYEKHLLHSFFIKKINFTSIILYILIGVVLLCSSFIQFCVDFSINTTIPL